MGLLTSRIGRLSLAQYHVFLQRLHCINVLVIFFLNKINFSERTSSYDFDDLEIFDAYVLRAVVRIRLVDPLISIRDRTAMVAIHF